MEGLAARELVGDDDHVDGLLAGVDPRRAVGRRQAVDRHALETLRRELPLPADLAEDLAHVGVEYARIARRGKLRLSGLPADRDRAGAVDQVIAVANGGGQPEVG